MKRIILICFTLGIIFLCMPASAQKKEKFSVASFEYNPFDMTAQSARFDGNGNRYAIIKVSSTTSDDDLKEYTFNFGNFRSFIEKHDSELWIYVQKNAKTVTISRQGYAAINNYDLKTTIESGKTYVMMLSTATTVINKQMLQFVVKPANSRAIVSVRGSIKDSKDEVLGVVDDNGFVAAALEYGIYTYSVVSPGYQISEGRIILSDKSKTHIEEVQLYEGVSYEAKTGKTNEVKFTLNPSVKDAVVLLKKKKAEAQEEILGLVDNSGILTKTIDNGTYMYRVIADNYHIVSGQLALTNKTTETTVDVDLKPNFSNVTLFVDMDADIYLNGDIKGQRSWTGVLKAGKYQVECRKNGYRTSSQIITVNDDDDRTFKLPTLEPVAGSLNLTSTPINANVILDGKEYGKTPLKIDDILTGTHELTLSHDGYMTRTEQIEVKEGDVTELDVELYSGGRFTFESKPNGAEMYINGRKVGKTPYSEDMLSGDYDVKLTYPKYLDYERKITLDPKSNLVNLKMKHDPFKRKSFFLQASEQVGSAIGAVVSLGTYIRNLNVELDYFPNAETTVDVPSDRSYNMCVATLAFKFGYGIKLNKRIRLTPQLGYCLVDICDDVCAEVKSLTIGARLEYMLTRWVGVCLSPEAMIPIDKDKTLEEIKKYSSTVKGWCGGFNVRFGIFLNL